LGKNKLQLLIYLSAILLSAGVFLPLASFPVYGEANYYRIAEIEAWLVIVFALTGPALILGGREKFTILSPIAVWTVLLYPALRSYFESTNDTVLKQLGNQLSSAMVDFASNLFLNIGDFHWGGYFFLTALIVFSFSNVIYRIKA
jgi:hypothetical protein